MTVQLGQGHEFDRIRAIAASEDWIALVVEVWSTGGAAHTYVRTHRQRLVAGVDVPVGGVVKDNRHGDLVAGRVQLMVTSAPITRIVTPQGAGQVTMTARVVNSNPASTDPVAGNNLASATVNMSSPRMPLPSSST